MTANDIKDLSEYVSSPTSLISLFSTIRYKLVYIFNPHLPTITISPQLTLQSAETNECVHAFNTNIHSYFYMAKYTLSHLSCSSAIINNASINVYIGLPDLLDYTSTKGAIISFTRGLSNQYVGRGIRVNAVAPGPVWTPLIPATMADEALKSFTAPMGRPAQPSEIATCFVFLASMDSSAISGQTLHPNGGVVVNG